MTSKIFTSIFCLFLTAAAGAQTVFHTADIVHFFQAFDSVQTTTDKQAQVGFVQRIYLDQGSAGVKYAIGHSVDGGATATADHWVDFMQRNHASIVRMRPYFNTLPEQMNTLVPKFVYFKQQYPPFKDGNVYFVIGLGMFGGRPEGTDLFIGCEVLANEDPDWAVNIVLHEYVHTLQRKSPNALLAHCLYEGAADFIAETISQKSLSVVYPNGYIDFGNKHEKAVWKEFKKFIPSNQKGKFFDWLYGTKGREIKGRQVKDLGYFMGYKICKSYYDKAADKKQAIKDIIEMDVSTDEKARTFLLNSGYVPKRDLPFIQRFAFAKVVEAPKGVKMVQHGYQIADNQVVFRFDLPQGMDKDGVKFVSIAGSFNGWNPQDVHFRMENLSQGHYQFVLPVTNLTGKYHEFKFVINGDNWQAVPENALNENNGNLTLEIK